MGIRGDDVVGLGHEGNAHNLDIVCLLRVANEYRVLSSVSRVKITLLAIYIA